MERPADTELDVFEAISTTRAIRRLRTDPVPRELIHRTLAAATRAPSGGNRQPWRFVVVDDREKIQQLAEIYRRGWEIYMRDTIGAGAGKDRNPERAAAIERNLKSAQYLAAHIHEAPVLIMVCAAAPPPAASSASSIYPAIQNLTVAARAQGLGTSITTVLRHFPEEVQKVLNIPENATYLALIPMGWPKGRFGAGPRKPVHEVAFLNEWGNPWPIVERATVQSAHA